MALLGIGTQKKSSYAVSLSVARKGLALTGVDRPEQDPRYRLYEQICSRKEQTDPEAGLRATLYRRLDNLYYPTSFTDGGADHWASDRTAKTKGSVHISLNTPPVYVDIPADIQAIPPEIDVPPDSSKPADLEAADRVEKLFWMWWANCEMNIRMSVASRIRSLYGAVAIHPYWDADEKRPDFTVVENPENLRIGWGASDFTRMDWALNCYQMTPQAVLEDFGLDTKIEKIDGSTAPLVYSSSEHEDVLQLADPRMTLRTDYEKTQVDVYDYWYKKVTPGKPGKKAKVEIRNAIYIGNYQVYDAPHPEFDEIPYIYIPNGKLPGSPEGRSELYDLEQVFREKDEAISRLGQIFASSTGDMYQLNGPDVEAGVIPKGTMPKANSMVAPGPNAVINPITPYLPAFQSEAYLDRLDTELARMSGIDKLLMGLGDAGGGSSKETRARVSLYVPRINLKRQLFYLGFIFEHWEMAATMWERKDPDIKEIIKGHYGIVVTAPEIVAHDDLEQMNRAVSGVQNRVISLRTAQKWVGIENPTEETQQIMHEQTNASLNPGPVTQQIQLIAASRQLNIAPQQAAQQEGQPAITLAAQQAQMRQNNPAPPGSPEANQPAAGGAPPPDNAAAPNGAPSVLQSQTMNTSKGQSSGRILSSTDIPVGQ